MQPVAPPARALPRGRHRAQPGPFRPDIQGLRAIAVGLVVLNHAGVSWLSGGYVGVDVFFVISGFLITGVLLNDARRGGAVRFGSFYARRARRILPAATLVVVVTCALSVHLMNYLDARRTLTDAVWASLFSANIRFAHDGTDYFHQQAVSPLQHYWSLAVEEQFYVVWPVIIALTLLGVRAMARRPRRGGRHRRASRPAAIGFVWLPLTAVFVASLALSIVQTVPGATAPYFSTLDRAWELALGAMLALVRPALKRLPFLYGTVLSWLGVAAIVVAAVGFDATTLFPGWAALVPVLGAGAIIAGGAADPDRGAGPLLCLPPLRLTGDISYSLYLWHWPVLVLGAVYAGHALSLPQNLGLLAVAYVLSLLSYHWVENPVRQSRRLWGRRPLRALVMWPASVTAVAVAVLVAWPSGFTGGTDYTTASFQRLSVPQQVAYSVHAAEKGTAIPADLTPSVQDISTSFHSIGACSGYQRTTNEICQYGDPAGRSTAVLFGNSHATMWIPALSPTMKAAHWKFYPMVKESCAFPGYLGSDKNCAAWYSWAMQQIARLHPSLIIVGGDISQPGWQDALAKILAASKAIAPKVSLLRLAPGLPEPPTNCLLARGATLRSCLFQEDSARVAADQQAAAIAAAAHVRAIDTGPWFCADNLCPTVIGSLVAYADIGHVSAPYATHLVPELAQALAPDLVS